MRRVAAGVAGAAALALGLAPSADGGARTVAIDGARAPGPDRYERVFARKLGPSSARRVLVLVPGTFGGAGGFSLVARHLVRRVPGLQVWAVDRRTQAIEDTRVFKRALRGKATPERAFDYYLGAAEGDDPGARFAPVDPSRFGFARGWGMEVALEDLRRVVRAARRGGRSVILGGHSLGASLASAYAAWSFGGRPGFRDLDGLVLVDGGLLGTFRVAGLGAIRSALHELQGASPFAEIRGLGSAEAAGILLETIALHARLDPRAEASALQAFPGLPPDLRPADPVTNRALLGYALDRFTSPRYLAGLFHVDSGRLAAEGALRDWVDTGISPVARLARTFAQQPLNAVEWYFPTRLGIDRHGADRMRRNPAARLLGLRLRHTREIDVPLYAVQTAFTGGRALAGARRLVRRSRIHPREAMLVDLGPGVSHLDPLTATPARNRFLRTLARFLRRGPG